MRGHATWARYGAAAIAALALSALPACAASRASEPEADLAITSGEASYYGARHAGNRTASGERFDPDAFTAAHRTLPFGSRVRVTDPSTGRSVVVRINDRGPFHGGRIIDLSQAAAEELGMIRRGRARVELEVLDE